jgi:hypothetical protein
MAGQSHVRVGLWLKEEGKHGSRPPRARACVAESAFINKDGTGTKEEVTHYGKPSPASGQPTLSIKFACIPKIVCYRQTGDRKTGPTWFVLPNRENIRI